MFCFGDVKEPLPESVELLESIALEYISEVAKASAKISGPTIKDTNILFVIRKNTKQYNRGRELKIKKLAIDRVRRSASKEDSTSQLVNLSQQKF